MSFIRSRLRRLETRPAAARCAECKLAPGGHGYTVVADGEDAAPLDREGNPVDPDERCRGCGRFLWFVIRVAYEDAPTAEAAGERWP